MSTESLFKNVFQTSTHSPNVSDAEELELLTKFQNLEERSRLKYKKKLEQAKKRINELEKKVAEYESQLANINKNKNDQQSQSVNEYFEEEEEENSEINLNQNIKNKRRMYNSNFRSSMNRNDIAKAQYITYLENFADVKCDEVECLLNRLLKLQQKRKEKLENHPLFKELQRKCEILSTENEKLREDFSKAKLLIEKFTICHRVSKAERRTRELQELASIRGENESKNLELYSFISTQFRQFVNIDNSELNEKTVRAIVMKAAEMLKKQYQ